MIQLARLHKVEPKPKPKSLAQQKADFTAEGAPPLERVSTAPTIPHAAKRTTPGKAAPNVAALARPLSAPRR